jgi:hypothetical protein
LEMSDVSCFIGPRSQSSWSSAHGATKSRIWTGFCAAGDAACRCTVAYGTWERPKDQPWMCRRDTEATGVPTTPHRITASLPGTRSRGTAQCRVISQ